jgi:hypothetical protein
MTRTTAMTGPALAGGGLGGACTRRMGAILRCGTLGGGAAAGGLDSAGGGGEEGDGRGLSFKPALTAGPGEGAGTGAAGATGGFSTKSGRAGVAGVATTGPGRGEGGAAGGMGGVVPTGASRGLSRSGVLDSSPIRHRVNNFPTKRKQKDSLAVEEGIGHFFKKLPHKPS